MPETTLPPELETLNATQVAASFRRSRNWWSRVRKQYEEELGFPRPVVLIGDRRKGGAPGVPGLIYNKQAVLEWHRRNGSLAPATVERPFFDVAALGAAR